MKKKKSVMSSFFMIFYILVVAASAGLCAYAFWLKLIPWFIPVIFIVLLILLGFAMLSRHSAGWLKNTARVFSVFLLAAILLAGLYLYKFHGLISESHENSKESIVITSLYVKNNSKAQTVEDLNGKAIAVLKKESEAQEKTIQMLEDRIELKQVTVAGVFESIDLLDKKEVDGMLIEDYYLSLILEEYPDFESEYRKLEDFTVTLKTDSSAEHVDVTKKPFLVYISGIDTYGSIKKTSRSDVNMIVAINPVTSQVLMVNTPRDTFVESTCMNNQRDKLTHCGLYGVNCSIDTLENLYDIDLNYYVRINFSSVKKIVDAIGGVTVEVETPFCLDGICLKKGTQKLNGEQALMFARERHSLANGDNDRGKNQQKVIKAIVDQLTSPAIVTKLDSLLGSLQDSFETNIPATKLMELIRFQIEKMPSWNMKSIAIEGLESKRYTASMPSSNLYVYLPDMLSIKDAKSKIDKVFNGETLTDDDLKLDKISEEMKELEDQYKEGTKPLNQKKTD